jgi:hypothetical protein
MWEEAGLTSKVVGIRTKASVPAPLRSSILGGAAILESGFRSLVGIDLMVLMILFEWAVVKEQVKGEMYMLRMGGEKYK